MLSLIAKRGLTKTLVRPTNLRMVQRINNTQFIDVQARQFAKNKNKKLPQQDDEDFAEPEHKGDVEAVEEVVATPEPVVVATPQPVAATPQPEGGKSEWSAAGKTQAAESVEQSLYAPFTVGDIKVTNSTPDNKPPSQEDTIEGRYATVLFVAASEQESLYAIYEDFSYLDSLYVSSESFRLFTQNAGIGMGEMKQFTEGLQQMADFHPLTIKFLEILAESKRLVYIKGISSRYLKLYAQVNKEEKITIISHTDLNESEKAEVLAALQQNPQNAGKQFQLDFTVDESIGGGLQMYTETEFMDMSLNSRLTNLRQTITKLTE